MRVMAATRLVAACGMAAVGVTTAAAAVNPAVIRSVESITAAGKVGVSVSCGNPAQVVEASAGRAVRAGGTVTVPILLAALAADDRSAAALPGDADHTQMIVNADTAAANAVLARAGGGSTAEGTRRVNRLLREIGMTDTTLDGPFRTTPAPSRKRTTAHDLRVLMDAVDAAAAGRGRLVAMGVTRAEARHVLALMERTAQPGLVSGQVSGRVAHNAGRLADVRNEAAVVVRPGGARCRIGITTEGLGPEGARTVGRRVAREVVAPLTAAAQAPDAAPSTRDATDDPGGAAPSPDTDPDGGGVGAIGTVALVGAGILAAAVLARHLQLTRRRRRRVRERGRRP